MVTPTILLRGKGGEESHTIARDARASSAERTRWRPRILRPVVTVSVALVLLGIVGALEAFLRLSHAYSGFSVPSAAVRFGLTYGPVVAFVVLGMAWKSCEIEVKMLAPWTTMYQRPTPAKSSILLDYVGADYASVLYQAIAHRHWTVLLAILGSAMFSICTITATSLWAISSQDVAQPTLLRQTTTLGTYFNDTSTGAGYVIPYIGGVIYHMQPPWIDSGYAITAFEASDPRDWAGSVSARVAAYSASLTCEPVTVAYAGDAPFVLPFDGKYSIYQLRVSWRGCDHLVNVTDSNVFESSNLDLLNSTAYYGRMIDLVCGPFRAGVITVSRHRPGNRFDHIGTACSPVYTRAYPTIVLDFSDNTIQRSGFEPSERVDLPGGDGLLYWIHHSNSNLAPIFSDTATPDLEQNSFLGPWPDANPLVGDTGLLHLGTWINLLGRVRNVSLDDVMDPIRLGNISRDVFHDIFPYVAQAAYSQPTQKVLPSQRRLAVQRLFCREGSLRLTQGALCVVVLIAIVLCVLHPATHINGDPRSLLHAAEVLGSSAELEHQLGGAGAMSEPELSRQLQTVSCQTEDRLGYSGPTLRVLDMNPDIVQEEPHAATTRLLRTWRPFMLSIASRVGLISVLAMFIVAVEVLLRRSERNAGLGYLPSSRLGHYAWLYAAPTTLFVLGLAVGSLDFAVRVTGRYQLLARRPWPARTLSFSPVCVGELTITPRSLSHGLFLVALTSLTALLLPITKIVIAGVFETGYFNIGRDVMDVHLTSQFAPVYNGSTTVGKWSLLRDPEFTLTRPWTNYWYAVGSIDFPLDYHAAGLFGTYARLPVAYGTLEHCEAIETYISDSHPDLQGTTATLTFDNYPLCTTVVLAGLNSLTTYFGRVWKYEETEVPVGCSKQIHFVFGATPSGDPNVDKTLPVVHIACDAQFTLSSMMVYIPTGVDPTPTTFNIDDDTEQNRTDIPFENYTDFLTGSGVLPTPFNADLDSFFAGLLVRNRTTLADYLDIDAFKPLVTEGWRDLWALHLDQHMRIPADSTISAARYYHVARLMITRVPARILEGLLSVILIIVTIACVLTPIGSVLPKSPLSVAAQMSLFANSRLLRRISEGATLDGVFVRLGWWTDPRVDGWERYGIDIVEENEESFPLTKI